MSKAALASVFATADVLVPGLGMRLNGAPIGFCSVVLVTGRGGERILVDTGVHQTREMLLTSLRDRSLTPSDIDVVVLTHLHFDHCENVALFPEATVVVHEAEIRECENHPGRDVYVADFWRELLKERQVEIMSGPELALGGGVEAMHMPGHRHGLVTVSVDTVDGLLMCTSDAARNARELLERRSVVSDPSQIGESGKSIARILEMSRHVIPGHDRPMRIVDGRPVWDENLEIAVDVY